MKPAMLSPWSLLWPYTGRLLGLFTLIALGTVGEAIGLTLLAVLLKTFVASGETAGKLSLLEPIYQFATVNPQSFLLVLVAVYLIKSLLALGGTYASFSLANRITDDCRIRLIRAFLYVPLSRLESRKGGMLQMVLDEPGMIALGLGAAGLLVQNFLSTLSVYAVLFYIAPTVTAGLTAIGLAAVGTLWALSRWSLRLGERRSRAYKDGYCYIAEMLDAMKQFRAFGLERDVESQADAQLTRMRKVQLKLNVLAASPRLLIEILFLSGIAATAIAMMSSSSQATILTSLGLAVAATVRLLPGFSASASTWVQVQQAWPAMMNIARELGRLEAAGVPHTSPSSGRPVRFTGAVEFHNVYFSYPQRAPVLNGVSLAIKHGSFTALVGPSGVGKSTLVDLLCGFIHPVEGRITIDGMDLRDVSLLHWRQQLGVVLQDGFLLSGTLRENLCLLRPDCSERELDEVLTMVGADAIVRELPEGLETRVGERGALLSGGQRQRLALARVLLRQPRLLILDEATSALDVESEEAIYAALSMLRGQMSMIVIAHRLSPIRKADEIFVIDGGKVVERGRHEDLLLGSGVYAAMWLTANLGSRRESNDQSQKIPIEGAHRPDRA